MLVVIFKPFFKSSNIDYVIDTNLAGSHIWDWAMSLYGFQLVQTPLQLLQRLQRKFTVLLFYKLKDTLFSLHGRTIIEERAVKFWNRKKTSYFHRSL